MNHELDRRDFLYLLGMAGGSALGSQQAIAAEATAQQNSYPLQSFDYRGVTLLDSRWKTQVKATRELYFQMSDDDMLKGFRRTAGLPAPGNDMKGWCRHDCGATFGQWISGLSRLGCATGDKALCDKAIYLTREWEKTLGPGDNPRMGTYAWEKMSCGLVDVALYADYKPAWDLLERITTWAAQHFDRSRSDANEADRDGRRPHGTLEWYTLPENSLRAYQATGRQVFVDFAKLWFYTDYWNRFLNTDRPDHVALLHSYSHVNTFCGAAMAYEVTGDKRFLQILINAYSWICGTQTYASGGYGPGEWSVSDDGSLGHALDLRLDTAEIPCGSWAGFKLTRYLMRYTGQARFGDWAETLLYNGIGAALPVKPDGSSFYYADYRVGMGTKQYFWEEWPCCSGTYIQSIADYHNLIYFKGPEALYVNLAIPSSVNWEHNGQTVTLTQSTRYPESEETSLVFKMSRAAEFTLHTRVPAWCSEMTATVNGVPSGIVAKPSEWASLKRMWSPGDIVTVRFPMKPRLVPVDEQQPKHMALMYGPMLMAQDARFSFPLHGSLQKFLPR